MKPLWLVCCSSGDYPRAQREIDMDAAEIQVLRLDDPGTLERVAQAFAEPPCGAVLYSRHATREELEGTVGRLKGAHGGMRIVVILDELDVAHIAQLFRAGATEVVAADGARDAHAAHTAEGTCRHGTGEGNPEHLLSSPLDMAVEPGAPRETDGLALNAAEAAHVRAPQDQPDGQGARLPGAVARAQAPAELADGLDEPDGVRVQGGAARRPAGWREPAPGHAPVVCLLSGQGGAGKTTLAAAMAWCSSQLGLRTAAVDLDLMFGNLYRLVGVTAPRDLGALLAPARTGTLDEEAIVGASMRVAPGFTLWGPLAVPEQAELMGPAVELLLATLRAESDVVFVDTATQWGDAVAAAVELSERCLMVCDGAVGAREALRRVIKLAERIGVPRTRMTCVANRVGARALSEERASALEIAASLSSALRIAEGGPDTVELLRAGRMDQLMAAPRPFPRSVRAATGKLLLELGCPVDRSRLDADEGDEPRPRLRLPWAKTGGA